MRASLLDDVGALLREVADCVVMPRFAALAAHEVEMKGADDPVTIADREAEVMIDRALRLMLPGSRVVGEEACSADPRLLDDLGAGAVWIVDPIDGTGNFAIGRAPFAMMVALLEDGELAASWILDPLGGRLCLAEHGSGAWADGERIRVDERGVEPARLHGIVSEAFIPADQRFVIERLRSLVPRIEPTARCAGHEYPLVALGQRDFILYWRTLVWDHAPGALLLREAGGSVSHLDGTPYHPTRPKSGLLLARNPLISRDLLVQLRPA